MWMNWKDTLSLAISGWKEPSGRRKGEQLLVSSMCVSGLDVVLEDQTHLSNNILRKLLLQSDTPSAQWRWCAHSLQEAQFENWNGRGGLAVMQTRKRPWWLASFQGSAQFFQLLREGRGTLISCLVTLGKSKDSSQGRNDWKQKQWSRR